MQASYLYTAQIWPSLLTAILVAGLAIYAWRHREVPGALPFAVGCLFAALWALASVLEDAAVADHTRILWAKAAAALQLPSVTAIACFVLEYVWPGRWLTRRNVALLSIIPAALVLLVITEPLHGLLWRGFRIEDVVIPLRKPLMWGFIAYGYLLSLLELVLLSWLFLRSPRHRAPVAIIMLGQIAARILYLADERLDVYTITIALATYAIALFAFRILDATALARETALASMSDGMLVLDPSGNVAAVNPAAEGMLRLTAAEARGRALDRLAGANAGLSAVLGALNTGQRELSAIGADRGTWVVSRQRLEDFRGLHAGDLILLRDITEQRTAQQRLLEQERALATFREREQLARELHDSIGQVLGYAGFQTDSAITLLERDQATEAVLVLQRLVGVLREAHGDLRQQILDLRALPSPRMPFCEAVSSYLEGYTANYGITATLEPCEGIETLPLAADAQTQLFRILQEALSNVRRHSGARQVRVSLRPVEQALHLTIADSGHGFETSRPATEGHLGLGIMRERAEQMGGRLEISSGPSGTTIQVTVPCAEEGDATLAG